MSGERVGNPLYVANLERALANAGKAAREQDRRLARAEERVEFWMAAYQQALDDISTLLHAADEPRRADLDAMLRRWRDEAEGRSS